MKTLEEIRKQLNEASPKPQFSERRLKRLNDLLAKLNSGKNVAIRDLKNALTEDEWYKYEMVSEHSKIDNDKQLPDLLKIYADYLKKADFFFSRAQALRNNPNSKRDHLGRTGKARLNDKAESEYENALLILEDFVEVNKNDPNLFSWFDRDFSFEQDATNFVNADAGYVPRLKASRSKYSRTPKRNKTLEMRNAKMQAIQDAIDALNYSHN